MLLIGDCFEKVKEIEESSVQAIVTSPLIGDVEIMIMMGNLEMKILLKNLHKN